MKQQMKNITAVIQISGDDGLITSFNCWYKGEKEAEQFFSSVCKEVTDMNDEEIEQAISDGYANVPGGGMIQLCSSGDDD